MTHESSNIDRRKFLKGAAATAAVSLSAAGSAAASTPGAAVEARYADPLVTETALGTHASDLLAMLARDGLLESADVAALNTRRPASYGDVAKKLEGTVHLQSGGDLERIVSVKHLDRGVLTVTVEPGDGRSYAFFEPADGSSQILYNPEVGVKDVSSQECNTRCSCGNPTCEGTWSAECTTCCDGECQTSYFCNC
jgi:uncharacterized protein YdbL (DUF1318 family)